MSEAGKGCHVGIILDGNGRWARQQMKPRLFGHNAGFKNVRTITDAAADSGVTVLTLYAFAIANWRRDKEEVDGLFDIFRRFFKTEFEYMMEQGYRCRMIGSRDERVPADVMDMILDAEEKSKNNTGMVVQMALNYDGVDEVTRATQTLAARVAEGELKAADITQTMIMDALDTGGQQEPDVVIRTGMPQVENERGMAIWRSSSFLQLQSAQSVCVSTPVLWPDFSPEDLKAAIAFADPDGRLFGGQRKEK